MGAMPMLLEAHSGNERLDRILDAIEYVAVAIEVLAVVIIVIGIMYATVHYIVGRLRHDDLVVNYRTYRAHLGAGLLLGLEVLVAADVIRTVALEPTLESVAVLGILVTIRIALAWSIVVEIEHHWPWQKPTGKESQGEGAIE